MKPASALLAIFVGSGYWLFDDLAKREAGNLSPFFRSGLLDEFKAVPLSSVEPDLLISSSAELLFMCHNAVLLMQAMGLGGWFYSGLSPLSILGAFAAEGVCGLGCRFLQDKRWTEPDPVGLDGHYETLGPPYQADMRSAVQVFAERNSVRQGRSTPAARGLFALPRGQAQRHALRRGVSRLYGRDGPVPVRYYGKSPPTVPRVLLCGYVQAQHIDTEFYDKYYKPGAYLDSHTRHMQRWHSSDH